MPDTRDFELPHEHKYELKIGVDEITWENPFDGSLEGTLDIYAECECGAELDQSEIEEIINAHHRRIQE